MGEASAGHNSRKRSKPLDSFGLKVDHSISYQTLLTHEDPNKKTASTPLPEVIGHCEPSSFGLPLASNTALMPSSPQSKGESDNLDATIVPIDNAPVLEAPGPDIPDDYQFEIFRLRRRVAELESAVRDRDDKIRHCLTTIEDQLLFWRTGMLDHCWETMGGIQRRILRLESALALIKDIQSHEWPKLDLPACWKKER